MAFLFKLETRDGAAADLPTFRTAVPGWRVGDTIPLGGRPSLRVVEVRDDNVDEPPVLAVEEVARPAMG
jgi:hypothetical protein